jgi:hypothetical protein
VSTYLVFHPDRPGFIWAEVSRDGQTENVIVHNIIQAMKRGKYTKKGHDIRCVPNVRDSRDNFSSKGATTLGALFSKPKNRGNNHGLTIIAPENRYKGKVDWEGKRSVISQWMKKGISVSEVAKRFGVSPSTLSKANKRHNLYAPKQPPCK